MILPGTRKVKLADIVTEKGFSARKKTAHHESRKASIKRHGLINLIVIQDRTRKLLAGGDRLSALLALKVKAHEVRVFRGTEEEFEALQLAENIERRHNDDVDAMTKRYVELTTGEIEKTEQAAIEAACVEAADTISKLGGTPDFVVHDGVQYDTREPAPVGRPKTAKGKAREAVAAATGKTPEAIRQAEKRATAKERKATEQEQLPPVDPAAPLPPPVETFGLPLLTDDESYQVLVAQEALKKVEAALRKAQAVLLNEVEPNFLGAVIVNDVKASVYRLLAEVRAAYPVAVCAACKRLAARLVKCNVCKYIGFIGAEELLVTVDELRLGGDKAMVADGRGGFVPYAREVAKEEKAAERKTERKLRIELDDGSTFEGGV